MIKYKIAGLVMELDGDEFYINKKFNSFQADNEDITNLKIESHIQDYIDVPIDRVIIDEQLKWVREDEDNNYLSAYVYQPNTQIVKSKFEVDRNFTKAKVECLNNEIDSVYSFNDCLGEVLFRNFVLFYKGLGMHACAISWKGNGIVFSAPSGTGKTTQANLWKEFMGAEVLNGDRAIVRLIDSIPYVYGSPWTSSSPDYKNDFSPLKAIVVLEQSKENSIKRLSYQEILQYFMPRCFLPYHDKRLMQMALNNFEQIVDSTPVYLLRCRPEKEAVELVAKCIS